MMQKRTVYSLLLTSFILAFAFSAAMANTVSIDSKTVARCEANVLGVTVNNAGDISAFEIVLEVTSTANGAFYDAVNVSWVAGVNLTNHIVDLGGVDNVSPDTIRIAGMLTDAGDACLAGGNTEVANIEFTSNDVCDGTFDVLGATFTCPTNPLVVASTQFVDCATTTAIAAAVTAGTVTIENSAPTIDPIADATLHWGDVYSDMATGDDPDLHTVPGGCEALTYSLADGPAGMTVAANGQIVWPTTGADVCVHTIQVAVTDGCGASDTASFDICVQNTAPTLACPTDTTFIVWGDVAAGAVVGADADGGPLPLAYSVIGFSGPGAPTINAGTGAWEWATTEDNAYCGTFELTLAVSDGANVCDPCSPENADTCSVTIHVIPTFRVWIEKTHGTFQGHSEEVSLYLDSGICQNEIGGFDFLIDYDASALSFQSATPGQFLLDCGWEYFTYRQGPSGNCGPNACPTGKLRVVALAETNNGANHPACFTDDSGQLVSLSFLVTNDRTFECQYVPIRWCWYDCGDNGISSVTGDTLFISRHVYDFDNVNPIEQLGQGYPTVFGAQEDCDLDPGPDKPAAMRIVDFFNGGIDIVCADSIDARGDLNLNGLDNEIADAVLYTNYFIQGISAFTINVEGQTAASDVNADGIPLSVGDLVYQIRIIVGDALPYPKVVTPTTVDFSNNHGTLIVNSDVPMGAAFVVIDGNATPELLADGMEMRYAYDGQNTRVIVYSFNRGSFSGEFLQVDGEVVTLELATYDGFPVVTKTVPVDFVLNQNYPNPFNPTTTISFALPTASDYSLTIYNVNGQVVANFSGAAEAGIIDLEWDAASNNASGIYFYKLTAGDFTDTKKMVLLK